MSHRYIFSLSLLLLMFIWSSDAYAVTDRCPRHELKTSMKSKIAKTRVFRGTSRGFTEYAQGHVGGGGKILGFVEHKVLMTAFETKFNVVDIGNGKYCVRMEKVRGHFNTRPKLFMPTDYKKSSCEYKQVLKHEKRHLAAIKEFHKTYAKRFEAHLGRVARTVPIPPPVKTPEDVEKIKKHLNDHFVNEFRDFETKAWNLLLEKQRKIDSPQEYRGVAKRCDNW